MACTLMMRFQGMPRVLHTRNCYQSSLARPLKALGSRLVQCTPLQHNASISASRQQQIHSGSDQIPAGKYLPTQDRHRDAVENKPRHTHKLNAVWWQQYLEWVWTQHV